LPRHPRCTGGDDRVEDLALATSTVEGCSFEQVFLDRALVAIGGLVVLEPLGDLVGVVEDFLGSIGASGSPQELLACGHGGGDDELDSVTDGDADLEHPAAVIGADQQW